MAAAEQGVPHDITNAANTQGGTCPQPEALGEAKAAGCRAYFVRNGWQHDEMAESISGLETGTKVSAIAAPAPTADSEQLILAEPSGRAS
ncbi:MAG: hypothetical protein AB7O24_32000 [Kofleriaceae bacterium]